MNILASLTLLIVVVVLGLLLTSRIRISWTSTSVDYLPEPEEPDPFERVVEFMPEHARDLREVSRWN